MHLISLLMELWLSILNSMLNRHILHILLVLDLKRAAVNLIKKIIEREESDECLSRMIDEAIDELLQECAGGETVPGTLSFVALFVGRFMVNIFGIYKMNNEDTSEFLRVVEKLDWNLGHDLEGQSLLTDISQRNNFKELVELMNGVDYNNPNPQDMDGESSSQNPPLPKWTDIVTNGYFFSNEADSRLVSAALFVLRESVKAVFISGSSIADKVVDAEDDDSVLDTYRFYSAMNWDNLMGARLMTLNMLRLEDFILANKDDTKRLIEEHLAIFASVRAPVYPDGTRMSYHMMEPFLRAPPDTSSYESNKTSADVCTICHEILGSKAGVYSTVCDHEFHHTCMMKCMRQHRRCPGCREFLLVPEAEFPEWVKDSKMVRKFLIRHY